MSLNKALSSSSTSTPGRQNSFRIASPLHVWHATRHGRTHLLLFIQCNSRSSSDWVPTRQEQLSRRQALAQGAAALTCWLGWQPASQADGALPKGYEDTAVKLVAALREAINTDLSGAEEREVRRAADPAKGLVREFLSRWRGSTAVEGEESYRQLTTAIQQLGAFYQANGQRARLSSEVGRQLLDTLDAAAAALPQAQQAKAPSLMPFF